VTRQIATPMPPMAAEALTRARAAILAAMPEAAGAGGFDAARLTLAGVAVDELLDVAALLAAGAAGGIILTRDEWSDLATHLQLEVDE
jgi:hypothetical protein